MTKKIIVFLSMVPVLFIPLAGFAAEASSTNSFFDPTFWFNALKQNITIPIPAQPTSTEVQIPSPENALKEASPKLREINSQVKDEAGVDFSKLIGWFAKVLIVFFGIIVRLLQTVSGSLGGN